MHETNFLLNLLFFCSAFVSTNKSISIVFPIEIICAVFLFLYFDKYTQEDLGQTQQQSVEVKFCSVTGRSACKLVFRSWLKFSGLTELSPAVRNQLPHSKWKAETLKVFLFICLFYFFYSSCHICIENKSSQIWTSKQYYWKEKPGRVCW